jgi:hypothetical protein
MRAAWMWIVWIAMLSAAAGQSAGPGVVVSGTVVDATGGVVPGAAMELLPAAAARRPSPEPDDGQRRATTDGAGNFRFDHVAPGLYVVRATVEGFEPATLRLTVGARAPGAVRLTLVVAGVVQEATVTDGSLKADPRAAGNLNSLVVDQSVLENLPLLDQDYLGTLSRFLDPSATGTNGVSLIVDGLEASSIGVSASAIQQIKINQDPYSAEFFRPGRGRIEVITKAGSDAYHGTANLIVRDAGLNARDPFAVAKAPDQKRIYEGYLSGPLGDGKRSSFVVSVNRSEQDNTAFVHAFGAGGLIQGLVANPTRQTELSASVSRQQSDRTTITFRVSDESGTQAGARAGGLTLPEGAVRIESAETQFVFTMNTVLSSRLLHQTRVMYGQELDDIAGVSGMPRIVVQDAFVGGGAQQNLLRTEHHATLTDAFTWTPHRHTFKAGINVPDWSRRRFDDNTNTAGTFYFTDLPQYELGRPYAFIQQQGNGHQVFLEKVLGVFAQDEIQIAPRLTVAAGVRFDWQNYFHDDNNVSPRGSIAWAPPGLTRTIIRGGAGVFYDRSGPIVISDVLTSRAGLLRRVVITDPGYPDPVAPSQSLEAQPRSIVQLSPEVHLPSTLQYSAGIERQVAKATTVSVTYTGMRGYSLFSSRDVNAPTPPAYAGRPDPAYGVVRQVESAGRLVSRSLQVMVRGGITRGFSGQLQYTFSRAMNDTSGVAWFPANDYDLGGEFARADFDKRHGFEGLGTFKLGEAMRLGLSVSLSSGRPYTLLAGEDRFSNARGSARPAGVPRNSLTGPSYADLDLRWSREIGLHARHRPARPKSKDPWSLTVGVDAFNVLNHTNFTTYVGTAASPLFGTATSAYPSRRLQFSIRTKF